jgi:hypothetical protein
MIPSVGVADPFEGFFCHQHQFESTTCIFHFVLGRFDSGVQIIIREQAGNGDEKTEGGGDQTFGNTTRNGGRGSQFIPAHHTESVHHTSHRPE